MPKGMRVRLPPVTPMKKSKYVRIRNRPLNEQIAHEMDLEVFRELRKALPPENKTMELSLHQCVFGPVLIGSTQNKLQAVELGADVEECYRNFYNKWNKSGIVIEARVNQTIVHQVLNVINTGNPDPSLHIDLYPTGTYFQRKVWQQLQAISPGSAMSYKEIADAIGRANSARAIGNACNANPIAVIVPCHRAIRSDGKSGGYKWGDDLKQKLLDREKI